MGEKEGIWNVAQVGSENTTRAVTNAKLLSTWPEVLINRMQMFWKQIFFPIPFRAFHLFLLCPKRPIFLCNPWVTQQVTHALSYNSLLYAQFKDSLNVHPTTVYKQIMINSMLKRAGNSDGLQGLHLSRGTQMNRRAILQGQAFCPGITSKTQLL